MTTKTPDGALAPVMKVAALRNATPQRVRNLRKRPLVAWRTESSIGRSRSPLLAGSW